MIFKKAYIFFIPMALITMLQSGLVLAEKGPNLAAYAEDKNVVVIDEQYTSVANDPNGHYTNTFRYSTNGGQAWQTAEYPSVPIDPNNPNSQSTYNYCGPETDAHDVYTVKYLGPAGQKSFFSVGSSITGGVICSSSDGKSWTMDLPSKIDGISKANGAFYDIAFNGKNNYLAVGAGGIAWYSSGGHTWKAVNYSFGSDLNSVVYGNGHFVVGGNGTKIWYSPDGQSNWKPATIDQSGSADIEKIIYEPSANGGKGQFVAVGSYATIWTSNDGINWYVSNISWKNSAGETRFMDVAYGNGIYIAIGDDNTAAYAQSTQKTVQNWTADAYSLCDPGNCINNHPKAIIYVPAQKRFVAVAANYDPGWQDGFIFTTNNGTRWDRQPIFGKDKTSRVRVNYLATVISIGKYGLLAVPYGSGDAVEGVPASILYSLPNAMEGLTWYAACDLGFDCFNEVQAN
jgi:hypothetical protein